VSVGLETTPHRGADQQAIAAARRRGIDLEAHRTREWSSISLRCNDLCLAMEPWQLRAISSLVLRLDAQASLLGAWATPRCLRVGDPYGKSEETFQRCFGIIEGAVTALERSVDSSARMGLR
jgi:protein-tyrosine phosphatase